MQAILYVGHGSRVKEGNYQFESFIERVKNVIDFPIQEHCYIEIAEPSIKEGIALCMSKGATAITVIPVLLLSAGHAKVDIPIEIKEAKKKYPHIKFTYGKPLGVEQNMIDIVGDRLIEGGLSVSDSFTFEERQEVSVLLVGRGSSDSDANSDLAKIARLIWEQYPVKEVEICYLAATRPNFDEGLTKVVSGSQQKIIVIPYLLFTGILMKRMEQKIQSIKQLTENKDIQLCNYLGYHRLLVNVLKKRIKEGLNGTACVYNENRSSCRLAEGCLCMTIQST
ncbi:sirohydrochlorin chelatase [Bacillus sp. FJAT-45350]|uniref:sirohydrochlorin chelatase n=1 Tax=Bacillus sp. FJAT-45350 TaxID=2011014 RepID=UPI000BB81314|nr:sirohydrochlorin chelatase [Bacillus sp. FJAT-45350]